MAKTLRNIQQSVKDITSDDNAVLTSGLGLKLFNRTYRGLTALFDWPEAIRRAVLTSKTVATQEYYTFTGEDFPVFMDIKFVEVETPSYDSPSASSDIFGAYALTAATTRLNWKILYPPPNEFEWNLAGRIESVTTPQWFKQFKSNRYFIVAADYGDESNRWHSVDDGSTWVQTTSANVGDEVRYYAATDGSGTGATEASDLNSVAIRPVPTTAGYRIRIVGKIEPTEATAGTDTTVFLQSSADDALEHLLAAAWLYKLKNNTDADKQMRMAADRLAAIFADAKITTETIAGIV